VRIGLNQAFARRERGECGWAIKTGRLAADAANAWEGVQGPARKPGKSGQVIGAASIGVELDADLAIMAAICIAMAQWCAPWRRQQGGRRASSLACSVPVRGHKPRNRIMNTESQRRICSRCYTTRSSTGRIVVR
jgi:hypothetical protein